MATFEVKSDIPGISGVSGGLWWATTSECARHCRVDPRTVRRWIDHEQVTFRLLPGGDYRVWMYGTMPATGRETLVLRQAGMRWEVPIDVVRKLHALGPDRLYAMLDRMVGDFPV